MFEWFDHTADVGLRVRAHDLPTLFCEAARGLFATIVENPEAIRLVDTQSIQLTGDALDYLMFDWLQELVFLFDAQHLLLGGWQIDLQPGGLQADVQGETWDPERHTLAHEVKAVTYHGLKVQQQSKGWLAEVILDI